MNAWVRVVRVAPVVWAARFRRDFGLSCVVKRCVLLTCQQPPAMTRVFKPLMNGNAVATASSVLWTPSAVIDRRRPTLGRVSVRVDTQMVSADTQMNDVGVEECYRLGITIGVGH